MRILILLSLFLFSITASGSELHPALEWLDEITPAVVGSDDDDLQFTGKDGLVPLGFSPSGNFAYFIHVQDDACGSCPNFFIVNLISDAMVERRVWEGIDLEEAVRSNSEELTDLLERHGIDSLGDRTLKKFPLTREKEVFTASLEPPEEEGAATEVWFHSTRKGSKKIGSVERGKYFVSSVKKIDGYFMSPYENRIVVVTSGTLSGAEFAYVAKFFLFGSSLGSGFSR